MQEHICKIVGSLVFDYSDNDIPPLVHKQPGGAPPKKYGVLMENCPLGTLQDIMDRSLGGQNNLTFVETMTILQQVASALASLHDAGIAHRFVLADNVFIKERRPKMIVKLANFSYSYDARTNESPIRRTMQEPAIGGRLNHYLPHRIPGADPDDEDTYVAGDIYMLGLLAMQLFYQPRPRGYPNRFGCWGVPHAQIMTALASTTIRNTSIGPILTALLATNPEDRVSAKQAWVIFTHLAEEFHTKECQPGCACVLSQNPEASPDAWPENYHPTRGWAHGERKSINRRIPCNDGDDGPAEATSVGDGTEERPKQAESYAGERHEASTDAVSGAGVIAGG